MNSAIDLIQETEARGVRLEVEDDELYAAGPVDEGLLRRLCAHRSKLLSYLATSKATKATPKKRGESAAAKLLRFPKVAAADRCHT